MKKSLLFGAAACLLALSGCNNNDYTYTWPTTLSTLNLITDANGNTTVSPGIYSVSRTETHESLTGYIVVNNLAINPDAPVGFATVEQNIKSDEYGLAYYFANAQSATNGYTLQNANFEITRYFYWPKNTEFRYPGEVVIAQYEVNNAYKVKTFQPVTCYNGETTTSFPYMGQNMTNTTSTIQYMFTLDYEKNTADVIMLNAKFSGVPAEPEKEQVQVKGLKVSYDNAQISASGENITSIMVEGGATTPNEDYVFKSITFNTTNSDLTEVEIHYVIETPMRNQGQIMTDDAGNPIMVNYIGDFKGSFVP